MDHHSSTWKASQRPRDYRTPSPPPWSPIDGSHDAIFPDWDFTTRRPDHIEQPNQFDDARRRQAFGLSPSVSRHRSNASMDAFATIALATQPTHGLPRAKRASDSSFHASRPKRARVDFENQHESAILDPRPATSYQQSPVPRVEDAELLLFFSQHMGKTKSMPLENSPPDIQQRTPPENPGKTKSHNAGGVDNVTIAAVTGFHADRHAIDPVADRSGFARDDSIVRLIDSELSDSAKTPHIASSAKMPLSNPSSKESPYHAPEFMMGDQHAPLGNDGDLTVQDTPSAPQTYLQLSENDSLRQSKFEQAGASDECDWRFSDPLRVNALGVAPNEQCPSEIEAPPDQQDQNFITNVLATNAAADTALELSLRDSTNASLIDKGADMKAPRHGEVPITEPQRHQNGIALSPNSERIAGDRVAELDTAAMESQEQAVASSAVCAACRFSKNSLGLDSDINATSWINCDGCKAWFHFACAGFRNEREVRSVDKFRCKQCKPVHGATSYVRKSTRAHSAIDYAGLHQGVIKTSDDKPEHHYIRPIREGDISFLPENFPRMRPELVNAEFFERADGMKEPVIIPSYLNPQPEVSPGADVSSVPSPDDTGDGNGSEPPALQESEKQRIPDDGQDGLGMVMPRGLTVRKVADLYGPEEKIEVIDVKSQNGEGKKWNMRRWVDYYENPSQSKVIRNVISLEFSQSKLGRLVRRPQLVRDLDLQDAVWPPDLLAKGDYPHVQFYCLMSVADCFTDFHIDFGGSSVFYHILKGKKTFLFIPPKEKNLKKYEEWCMSPAQNWTFLPDQTKECYRVDLSEGDTMLIPSGWIHAVWTPEDSLVIGGNFLTRLNYGMQFRVAQVEKNTGVARKFRYPQFQKIQWYSVLKYLEEDPVPSHVTEQLVSGVSFRRDQSASDLFDEWGENSKAGAENFHSRYYPHSELEGLPELLRYVLRTVLIENGTIVEGISAETRNAVKKSIPRGHGEPMDLVKKFAIWVAWKRGNELIPYWAYPEAVIEAPASDKHSAVVAKRLAQEAASKAPRRQSQRMQLQREQQVTPDTSKMVEVDEPATIASPTSGNKDSAPTDEVSNARETTPNPKTRRVSVTANTHRKTACDSCRKRRRACKHKDISHSPNLGSQNDSLQPKLSRTEAFLNGNALQEKLSSISGLFNSLASKTDSIQTQAMGSLAGMDDPSSPTGADGLSGDSLNPLNNLGTGSLAPTSQDGDMPTASESNSPPRPRAKACNHCRKSKRRCIHDAFGKEDPIKIAESAVPRPHARKTNRYEPPIGKQTTPISGYVQKVAPIATMVAESDMAPLQNVSPIPGTTSESQDNEAQEEINNISDSKENVHTKHQMQDQVASGRDSALANSHEEYDKRPGQQGEKIPLNRYPASSSLVSPPASSHSQDLGQSSPIAQQTPSKSRQGSIQSSSHAQEAFRRHTPESGTLRESSRDLIADGGANQSPPSKKGRRSISAQVADEESLRLIKQLQAQDLGLRRRGKG